MPIPTTITSHKTRTTNQFVITELITTQVTIEKDTPFFAAGEEPYRYPAGAVLGRITASGKYGPYDDGAGDGREVARYVLMEPVDLYFGGTVRQDGLGCKVLALGKVKESALVQEDGDALHANGKADLLHGGSGEANLYFG